MRTTVLAIVVAISTITFVGGTQPAPAKTAKLAAVVRYGDALPKDALGRLGQCAFGMREVRLRLPMQLRRWKAETGKEISPPACHRGTVLSLAFAGF